MMLSHAARLAVLALAVFFLVNAVCGLLVRLAAARMARRAERMRAADAARLLLAMRMLPAALGLLLVLGLCVPAYLWFEPAGVTEERAGWPVLALAALGAGVWLDSIARAIRAGIRSARLAADFRRGGKASRASGVLADVLVTDRRAPVLAVVGVWRPRIVVSSRVLDELTPEQLQAALDHERAHCVSRENLKRLLLLCAPDLLPLGRFLGVLEEDWARFAEWCADDRAAGSSEERSASLALALVRVARLGAAPALSPVSTSFLSPGHSLAERVDRLLAAPDQRCAPGRPGLLLHAVLPLAAVAVAAATLQPAAFSRVYHLLEVVLRG